MTTDELKALYTAGQYERVWQTAHRALLGGTGDPWVILLAGMSLLRLNRSGEFADLVHGAGGNAVLLCTWTLSNLLEDEGYEPMVAVGDLFPAVDPLSLISTYFAGCAEMMLGRHDRAMARFKSFRENWPSFLGRIDFIGDDRLNVMLRQGRLVAEAAEVERRRSVAIHLPELEFVGDVPPPAPGSVPGIVFASGNNHYFNAMASEFVAGMMPALGDAPLHIHVVDPDAESLALVETLRAAHGPRLAFSLEREPLFRTYTYYACSRFYVMTGLLDRYRAPILSFDIDIVPRGPDDVAPLFALGAGHDFCCFRTRRNEPASIFQASVMYWPDRPATHLLLDGLQHFCWEELRNPSRTSWMLDQAALFSLLNEPATKSALIFGDFAKLAGRGLEKFVRITFSNEVKGELRHRAQIKEPTDIILAHNPQGDTDR
jgi:hypothetical protein